MTNKYQKKEFILILNIIKYKKSFIEFNYIEKKVDNKTIRIVRERVWRFGEFNVSINENKLKEYKNVEDLFKSLQTNGVLVFDNNFPFENELLSYFDECSKDYQISYDDCSDLEDELEEEILNIIEEEGIYELEDNHGYQMVDTKYEIEGDLEIKQVD